MKHKQEDENRYQAKSRQQQIEAWSTPAKKTANAKFVKVIYAIEEALNMHEKLIADMQTMRQKLIAMKANPKVAPKDILLIDEHIKKVERLLDTYADLEKRVPLTFSEKSSVGEVLSILHQRYNTDLFKDIMLTLDSLSDPSRINEIHAKISKGEPLTAKQRQNITTAHKSSSLAQAELPLQSYTGTPVQIGPRFTTTMEAIVKTIQKCAVTEEVEDKEIIALVAPTQAAMNIASSITDKINQKRGEREATEIAKENINSIRTDKQIGMLRQLLDMKINTKAQKDQLVSVQYFPAYLKTGLSLAYPDLFKLNSKGDIIINRADPDLQIFNALGLELHLGSKDPNLNPAKFDSKALEKLYERDKNPLWLALMSTKPVDNNFTAKDKINTYLRLAELYKAGELGATEKYLGAYNLVIAARAIATKHREASVEFYQAFGRNSDMGKWILTKHEEHKAAKEVLKEVRENLNLTPPPRPKEPPRAANPELLHPSVGQSSRGPLSNQSAMKQQLSAMKGSEVVDLSSISTMRKK